MHGFVEVGGQLHAIPAPAGAGFVTVGGILFPTREAATPDEKAAVRRAARDAKAPRLRIGRMTDDDAVSLMAARIIDRARASGEVTREDFRQAGIPDDMIDANRGAAFARARRLETRLDQMVAQP